MESQGAGWVLPAAPGAGRMRGGHMGWLIGAVLVVGVPTVWLLLVARRDRRARASTADPHAHKDGGAAAGQPHYAQPFRGLNGGGDNGVSGLP
jgi:hypothetical protein